MKKIITLGIVTCAAIFYLHIQLSRAADEPWTLIQKITQAKIMLSNTFLAVGETDIKYTENRISIDPLAGKISVTAKEFKDPERQIALVLMNKTTGVLNEITITKHGSEIIAPPGYGLEIVKRPSGIEWNYWNTQFHVVKPENLVVVADGFPDIKSEKIVKKKRVRQIENIIYAPYSPDIASLGLADEGGEYIKKTVASAYNNLKQRGIVSILSPSYFEKLPLLEQSDYGEFLLDPKAVTDRVKYLIWANGPEAYGKTCNTSKACGWIQLTPGTYAMVRKSYPLAKLDPNFKTGAADHVNSMMAAILLYDHNLAGLIKNYGAGIVQDPRLEEYLAASYNGSPRWVAKSLDAYISQGADWLGHLKRETKGFISKLRLIKNGNLI